MNTGFNIIEELTRMKSLFDYKRGVIISEQKSLLKEDTRLSCVVNPKMTPTGDDGTNKTFQKTLSGVDTSQTFGSNGGWVWTLKNGRVTGTWGCKPNGGFIINIAGGVTGMYSNVPIADSSSKVAYYFDSSTGHDTFNPNGWKEGNIPIPEKKAPDVKKTSKKQTTTTQAAVTQSTTTPQQTQQTQTIFDIITSEADQCNPGKKYVWKTVRHQYQLEKQPTTPEGSEKTNNMLAKDWKDGWRPMCEKDRKRKEELAKEFSKPAEKIPYNTNVVQNAANPTTTNTQNTAPEVKTQITQKPLPNPQEVYAQQIANETPEQLYTRLYKAGVVKGDPQKQGRVRFIMPSGAQPLTQDQVNKLNEYMNSIGYEYYRKRNKDGGLVYTPVYQEQQD